MTRLDQFLDVDDRARDSAARVSALLGFVIWVVSRFVLDIQGKALGYLVMASVMILYAVRVWWYCASSERSTIVVPPSSISRRMALATSIFACLLYAPSAIGKVLDRRLREATKKIPLSPQRSEEIASSFEIARVARIKLPTATTAMVNQAIKNTALQDSDDAVVNAGQRSISYRRALDPSFFLSSEATPPRSVPPEMIEGMKFALKPLSVPRIGELNPFREDARKAIREFTRVIEITPEGKIRADALTVRAIMYLDDLRPAEALADGERLASIGGDLADIVTIEGIALSLRAQGGDLNRAIKLFTLGARLEAPTWIASEPQVAQAFRVDAIGNRGKAYYRLGEYQKCIDDLKTVIALVESTGLGRDYYELVYLEIVACYLHLGRVDLALNEVAEWVNKDKDNRIAAGLLQDLKSPDFDRLRWLESYEHR
jgi:tetratricopeptide (TPR) repeat protein